MFSSADLIAALRRRARRSLRPERPPGEFPPGWREWLDTLRERIGAVTGASSAAIIDVFLQRELALPPVRVGELNRWQAFATLWRQQWQPPEREGRRVRAMAYATTALVHLLLAVALLWLSYVRFTGVPAPAGEQVVQVEFIGQGAPENAAGGAPSGPVEVPTPTPAPAPAAAATPSTPAPPAEAPPAPSPPPAPQPEPPQPEPPQPPQPAPPSTPAAQPLQVTQTPQVDSDFVLPSPTPRTVELPRPQLVVPELPAPAAIEVVDVPTPTPVPLKPLQPQLTIARITAPELDASPQALPTPPAPLADVVARQVSTTQPQLQVPELDTAIASLPAPPSPSNASTDADTNPGNAATTATTPTTAVPASTTPAGGPPATSSGSRPEASASGAGRKPAAAPGAWASARRNDDWGLSDRDRPGAQAGKPGLFDDQGRARLPPGNRAAPGGGLPPGTVDTDIADLDRAGTWLKRPPTDYTPTRFDQFWMPNESLLEEWVRRNIREVSIAIPGTSKRLHCVVSLLQLGGGCGIDDPNMQDQEATARPPPDIPFKPELQEDQQALRKPGTAP